MSSPILKRLCERWDAKSPEFAIKKAVEHTFPKLHETSPPVDVVGLAAKRGIRVRTANMALDGTISLLRSGGYLIELNKAHSEARQRFTCAHEIAHTFFSELYATPKQRVEDFDLERTFPGESEEYLCNLAAAEMLLPNRPFSANARSLGLSANTLLRVSHIFRASIWCTARRFVDSWPFKLAVVLWHRDPDSRFYRAQWVVASAGTRIGQRLAAGEDVPIYKTFEAHDRFRGRRWVSLGGSIDDYFVDGLRLRSEKSRRILTLFILEEHAERLLNVGDSSSRHRTQETLF